MLSKLLFWSIALTLFAKLIFLPRFAALKKKVDRFIDAFLIALVVVYGFQLVLMLRR